MSELVSELVASSFNLCEGVFPVRALRAIRQKSISVASLLGRYRSLWTELRVESTLGIKRRAAVAHEKVVGPVLEIASEITQQLALVPPLEEGYQLAIYGIESAN